MCDWLKIRCTDCGMDYEKNKLKTLIFLWEEGDNKIVYYRNQKISNFELCKILNYLLKNCNHSHNQCFLIKVIKNILGIENTLQCVGVASGENQ